MLTIIIVIIMMRYMDECQLPALPLLIYRSGVIPVDNLGERRMSKPTDLVQGTLDLLILRIVANQPLHGWAISQRLRLVSNDVLQVQQGSLYPALHRLEQQGLVKADRGESENKRKAKYYTLTRAGRRKLEDEAANWARLSAAI